MPQRIKSNCDFMCNSNQQLLADVCIIKQSQLDTKTGIVHSVNGWTRGMQVKLWDPLRTRAIPERLRGVFTTRCHTNPRLPYLYRTQLTRSPSMTLSDRVLSIMLASPPATVINILSKRRATALSSSWAATFVRSMSSARIVAGRGFTMNGSYHTRACIAIRLSAHRIYH